MFNLANQAQAIVDQLAGQGSLGTVAFIEDDRDSERFPVTMPAAFLVLDELVPGSGRPDSTITPSLVWAVVVRSRSLVGPTGCLPLIDLVADVLVGFKPPGEVKALQLGKVEFYDKKHESVAYIVRFASVAAGKSSNALCGR